MTEAGIEPRQTDIDCPNRVVLAALSLGKLPLDIIDSLGQHIEGCVRCQGILQELDGLQDSFIGELKEYPEPGPLPVRPDLERQLQRAEQIGPLVWKSAPAPSPSGSSLKGRRRLLVLLLIVLALIVALAIGALLVLTKSNAAVPMSFGTVNAFSAAAPASGFRLFHQRRRDRTDCPIGVPLIETTVQSRRNEGAGRQRRKRVEVSPPLFQKGHHGD